jgi:hypothetical protein
MKINKKVLIPLFATAMGLSAIGGISGSVAWYQYNTKVSGSWVGVSTADGGVLQIKEGSDWVRDAEYGDGSDVLHPITFGAMTKTAALPAKAYKHPHAGVAAMTSWDEAVAADYVQFTVELQALKLNSSTGAYEPTEAEVHLDEMIISAVTPNKTDVGAALRVHISDGSVSHLFSATAGTINTHGNLDLDKDTNIDVVGGYKAFDDYNTTPIDYGDGGTQESNGVATLAGSKIFDIGSSGTTTLTVTIWLEGWQALRGSSIWDATKDSGSTFHFGMKLSTPKTTFLDDAN